MGRKKKSSNQPCHRRRGGLTWYQEKVLKEHLRKVTPSEPWVEEQIVTIVDKDNAGRPIQFRCHDPSVFPPGGSDTAMVQCEICGIFNPPNATESGQCLDHAEHKGWGPSPSAEAIRRYQRYYLKEEQLKLPSEDPKALLREIERCERRRAKKLGQLAQTFKA